MYKWNNKLQHNFIVDIIVTYKSVGYATSAYDSRSISFISMFSEK